MNHIQIGAQNKPLNLNSSKKRENQLDVRNIETAQFTNSPSTVLQANQYSYNQNSGIFQNYSY